MPIIHASYCKSTKIPNAKCADCDEPLSDYVALYGMAEQGDPPYTLRLCTPCARKSKDEDGKIAKVLP